MLEINFPLNNKLKISNDWLYVSNQTANWSCYYNDVKRQTFVICNVCDIIH